MNRPTVALACVLAAIIGAGTSTAATRFRLFDLHRGDNAEWNDVNVACGEIVKAAPDQVMCGGRDAYRFVEFTYTGIYVLAPQGKNWRVVYQTKRCCG